MNNDVLKRLRVRLLVATCAAVCTVPTLASSLERIDRESYVAIGKQMLAADPAASAVALMPAASAEPRFRNLAESLPTAMRGKVLTAEGLARTHLGRLDAGRAKRASRDFLKLRDVSTLRNGARIVSFVTQVQGVEVFRRRVSVLIDGEQTLRAISGVWPPVEEESAAKASLSWSLHAEDALAAALGGYGFEPIATRTAARPLPMEGGYLQMSVARAVAGSNGEHVQSSRAKQVLFPLAGKLIPAWYVETVVGLDGSPEAEYYSHVVSANDGEILFRHRQSEDADFKWNVWADNLSPFVPYPSPHGRNDVPYPFLTPTGTIPPTVPANVVTLQNAPFSRNDPWLPDAATVSTGNNTDAYIDLNNDGYEAAFDFRSPVFPFAGPDPAAYDPALDPAASQAQREAAVRQMFYVVNWTHDWYYDAGFDEAAGNAQTDNFGRGGLGNDSIRSEGQDNTNSPGIICAPNCANNANMATPADGGRPRMQMYTFSPTGSASFSLTAPSAATYRVGLPGWSGVAFDVSATVVQALDVSGTPAGSTTTDGCTAYTNAAAVAGNIVFVDRGSCDFVVKTQMAINAGAIGVLIGNVSTSNSPGTPPAMGCTAAPCPAAAFPALSLNLADANAMRSALGNGTTAGRMLRLVNARPDGTIDNQIMAHELGHYISNRLVENSSGLSTNMSRGMGEGWGDFHALLLTVKAEDITLPWNNNWTGAYPMATYATGNFFYGLRRYPYSYNFAINPLTLKHIQTGVALPTSPAPLFTGDNAEVHNTGEVWSAMLWECYVRLLQAHPFQEAQDRMKRYLINGYKLTPAAPLITEARDAIMAAVSVEDPADFQRFAQAFARRGLGIAAQTPDRFGTTNAGTVESFIVGGRVTIASVSADDGATCDEDGVLDNGETGVLTIRWNNTGWTPLSDSTLQVSSDFAGLTFSGNTLGSAPVPNTAAYTGTDVQVPVELVGAPANGLITLTVTAFDPGLSVATSSQFTLRVDYDDTPNASTTETFDVSPLAWNLRLTDGAGTLKQWSQATVGGNHVAHATAAGSAGVAWIESPNIAVGSGALIVTLNHRHRFEADVDANYDGGVVEVSVDGGTTWNAVSGSPSIYGGVISNCCGNPLQGRQALVGDSAGYPAFTTTTLNLGTTFSGQNVRLRLGLAEDEAAGTAGWDIDTVSVTGATNLPFARRGWQTEVCPNAQTSDIAVPGSVSASAPAGGTGNATLVIGNQGQGNLHWSIAESPAPTCVQPADVSWLSVGTAAGTTVGNTTTNVGLTFTAAGLGAGNYSASLCIDNNDAGSPRVAVPVAFAVSNVAPSFTSTPVTAINPGQAYAYAVVATDPGIPETLTITAAQKPAWLTLTQAPGTRTATLQGTPTVAEVGSHPVVLEVSDGALTTQQSFNVVVNAAPAFSSTPVTTAVQASAYSYAVTATDAGDTMTITAPTRPAWLTLTATGNGTANLSGTPQLADLGMHAVVLRVTDANGLFSEQSFSITVQSNNASPVAVGTVPAQVDDEGDAVTLDLSNAFDDADAGDVLAYSATGLPPGLSIDPATGIIAGTLDFQSAGAYNVTVTATDPDAAFAAQSFTWTVNDVIQPDPIYGDGFEGN